MRRFLTGNMKLVAPFCPLGLHAILLKATWTLSKGLQRRCRCAQFSRGKNKRSRSMATSVGSDLPRAGNSDSLRDTGLLCCYSVLSKAQSLAIAQSSWCDCLASSLPGCQKAICLIPARHRLTIIQRYNALQYSGLCLLSQIKQSSALQ